MRQDLTWKTVRLRLRPVPKQLNFCLLRKNVHRHNYVLLQEFISCTFSPASLSSPLPPGNKDGRRVGVLGRTVKSLRSSPSSFLPPSPPPPQGPLHLITSPLLPSRVHVRCDCRGETEIFQLAGAAALQCCCSWVTLTGGQLDGRLLLYLMGPRLRWWNAAQRSLQWSSSLSGEAVSLSHFQVGWRFLKISLSRKETSAEQLKGRPLWCIIIYDIFYEANLVVKHYVWLKFCRSCR